MSAARLKRRWSRPRKGREWPKNCFYRPLAASREAAKTAISYNNQIVAMVK